MGKASSAPSKAANGWFWILKVLRQGQVKPNIGTWADFEKAFFPARRKINLMIAISNISRMASLDKLDAKCLSRSQGESKNAFSCFSCIWRLPDLPVLDDDAIEADKAVSRSSALQALAFPTLGQNLQNELRPQVFWTLLKKGKSCGCFSRILARKHAGFL
ncbi:MAG: hypothetical protein LBC41_01870 [Clostridiales bacterium]|nr:hypothetical protein [Clostridiales bacterium]